MTELRGSFEFVCDPGHGWLLVSPDDLEKAGLSEQDITPYSYQNSEGDILALEEDLDAETFLNAWEKLTGKMPEIMDRSGGNAVRNWPRFGSKPTTGTHGSA
ncbi:MAG: hypothetical protein AAGD43_24110 [Pseudomonadota bacterium]